MKKITVSLMRDLEKQVSKGEISYSRMIEILNERLDLPESKNVPSEWNWDDGGASSIEAKAIIKKADERLEYANTRIQELEGKLKEAKECLEDIKIMSKSESYDLQQIYNECIKTLKTL